MWELAISRYFPFILRKASLINLKEKYNVYQYIRKQPPLLILNNQTTYFDLSSLLTFRCLIFSHNEASS